jgi:hypothetical protein
MRRLGLSGSPELRYACSRQRQEPLQAVACARVSKNLAKQQIWHTLSEAGALIKLSRRQHLWIAETRWARHFRCGKHKGFPELSTELTCEERFSDARAHNQFLISE